MRDGDEQLLLFWLLLATVSSSSESASSVHQISALLYVVEFVFPFMFYFQEVKVNLYLSCPYSKSLL